MVDTIILGIDPGVSGALAWLRNGKFEAVADLPTRTVPRGSRRARELDGAALRSLLLSLPPTYTVVEQVHAMPPRGGRTAGTQSSFNFGRTVGMILGELHGLRYPFVLVTPQAWKRAWALLGAPKAAALDVARKAYPEAALDLTRQKDVDRADALLIAGAADPAAIAETLRLAPMPETFDAAGPRRHMIEWRSEARSLTAWAEYLGLPVETLRSRLARGWSVERAFTEPKRKR